MSIPQAFIDELVGRTELVEIINEHISPALKRSGKNYFARCPFHEEKSPSFSVEPAKQMYYCFGCGAAGNAINFLMDYANYAFRESVEDLAQRQGLTVPDDGALDTRPKVDYSPLYTALLLAHEFYQAQLRESQVAQAYLRQRGLAEAVVAQYELGYAPPGYDSLRPALDVDEAVLLEAGLLKHSDDGSRVYDRFRGRLMFPIFDHKGRVIAFSGRVLDDSKPKYLNSPDTPIFDKGRELYGWYQAQQQRPAPASYLVVEGQTDVLALAQSGVGNVVASLGTAFGEQHPTKLFRSVDDIVLCFDGDEAGRKAAWRAAKVMLKHMHKGRSASFMFLPDGDDPDSLLRRDGVAAFNALTAQAEPLSTFLLDSLSAQAGRVGSVEGRARLSELAAPLLAQVPPGPYLELLRQALSERTGIAVPEQPRRAVKQRKPRRVTPPLSVERLLVALALRHPALALSLPPLPPAEVLPAAAILTEIQRMATADPTLDAGRALAHWQGTPMGESLQKLLTIAPALRDEMVPAEFAAALTQLDVAVRHRRRQDLVRKFAETGELALAETSELGVLTEQLLNRG